MHLHMHDPAAPLTDAHGAWRMARVAMYRVLLATLPHLVTMHHMHMHMHMHMCMRMYVVVYTY